MDPSSPEGRGDTGSAHHGQGLRDEYPPRATAAWALGFGALWGALGYSVLWEGTPFQVDRAFVDSIPGTLLLLPVRLVLWTIRWTELLMDRTFALADNHLWIGVAASVVGALASVTVLLGARALRRRDERR